MFTQCRLAVGGPWRRITRSRLAQKVNGTWSVERAVDVDVFGQRWWQCGSAARHPSSLWRCVVHSALGAKPRNARKSDPETGTTPPSNSGCRTGVCEDAQPVVTSCASSYLLAVATAMEEANPPETNERESVSRLGRKEALQCRHMRAYEDVSVDARPAERAREQSSTTAILLYQSSLPPWHGRVHGRCRICDCIYHTYHRSPNIHP